MTERKFVTALTTPCQKYRNETIIAKFYDDGSSEPICNIFRQPVHVNENGEEFELDGDKRCMWKHICAGEPMIDKEERLKEYHAGHDCQYFVKIEE